MKCIRLIITKKPEECLNQIKSIIPAYHQLSEKLMTPKYSYKVGKNGLLIINRGIGYPEVVLKISIVNYGDDQTELTGVFSHSIIQRLIIWVGTIGMFFGSLLYILGIIIGDISLTSEAILTCMLPVVVLIISISYLFYTEVSRKKAKSKIVVLLYNIFQDTTKDNA